VEDLESYIADIELALNAGAGLSALALALALPDICTTLEFTDPVRETRRDDYVDWCGRHLPKQGLITPENLYAIRCAFLHNGTGEMDRQRSRGTLVNVTFTWGASLASRVGLNPASRAGEKVDEAEWQHTVTTGVDMTCHLIVKATRHWIAAQAANPTVIKNLKTLVKRPRS
jgi:hypothetical protein